MASWDEPPPMRGLSAWTEADERAALVANAAELMAMAREALRRADQLDARARVRAALAEMSSEGGSARA